MKHISVGVGHVDKDQGKVKGGHRRGNIDPELIKIVAGVVENNGMRNGLFDIDQDAPEGAGRIRGIIVSERVMNGEA